MIKLVTALIFATLLYLCALALAWLFNADVGTTFAFLLAGLIIEDRLPADRKLSESKKSSEKEKTSGSFLIEKSRNSYEKFPPEKVNVKPPKPVPPPPKKP